MEAASARYGNRDVWTEAPTSQLLRYIQTSCSPENSEPNLALNIEIAEMINTKKGSAPREAAVAIVGYINHRNATVALLALALLDICVKNCGYPFYLQISTKEFLNELVRRFPERPPVRPSRVQCKILEAIEEWRCTICETSRYKEDLGYIRDMHRLLSYKGYSFPEARREDVAVLNPSDNLKSIEEMEDEEREAQAAKLQELIRRGTPGDLQEANRLMKVMAGYDIHSKTDYRAKAAEDVAKLQAKTRLLEERLEAFSTVTEMAFEDSDVFDELAAALRSAQPKIKKMCEDESDDYNAVARLLDINDNIHRTLQRYGQLKEGIITRTTAPSTSDREKLGVLSHDSTCQEMSLIDLNIESGLAPQPSGAISIGLENDLLGLDLNDGSTEGFDVPEVKQRINPHVNFAASSTVGRTTMPQPQYKVPFEEPHTWPDNHSHDDEEWTFTSSLPPERYSSSLQKGIANNTDLRIDFDASDAAPSPSIHVLFEFSNNSTHEITDIHYQLAVTKGFELRLRPQTGRTLRPRQLRGVIQEVHIQYCGGRADKITAVRLRWKVTYKVGNDRKEEIGELPEMKWG